jgi:hypothetical protein
MGTRVSRRGFLLFPLALLAARRAGAEEVTHHQGTYRVDVGVLYGLLSLSMTGVVLQEIDSAARQYRLRIDGQGPGAELHTETSGIIRNGRFLPTESKGRQTLRGRESRVAINYRHDAGVVEYHSLGYTLLLGRRRQVDDVVRIPPGQRVDDLVSAYLNFAANKLETDADGSYQTLIVRRAWKDGEGPDEVSASRYRAQLAPLRFRVTTDPQTGRLSGELDMKGLSSWARAGQPARITFDSSRHLESVHTSLILGTTVAVQVNLGA